MSLPLLYFSFGVSYTGPRVGHDSLLEVAVYVVNTEFDIAGKYAIVQPLTDTMNRKMRRALVQHELTRQQVVGGRAAHELMGSLAAWIASRCDGVYEPVLVMLDDVGEEHLRWYFEYFTGFDPFAGERSRSISVQVRALLANVMDLPRRRWAFKIAEQQHLALRNLWELRATWERWAAGS